MNSLLQSALKAANWPDAQSGNQGEVVPVVVPGGKGWSAEGGQRGGWGQACCLRLGYHVGCCPGFCCAAERFESGRPRYRSCAVPAKAIGSSVITGALLSDDC